MATQQQRRQQTQQKILQAASDLFQRQGYEQTSIAQIVARADIVKGTFYQHFQGKMDLLVALGRQDGAEQVQALIKAVEEEDRSPLGALQAYYRVMAQWFHAHAAIAEDVIISAIRLHDPQADSPQTVAHDFTRLMLHIARQRGEVRKDIDCSLQAIVLSGAITMAIIDWGKASGNQDLETLFEACFKVFIQGVQPAA